MPSSAAVRVVAEGEATEWHELEIVRGPELYAVDEHLVFSVPSKGNLTTVDKGWYQTRIRFWASKPARYWVLYAGSWSFYYFEVENNEWVVPPIITPIQEFTFYVTGNRDLDVDGLDVVNLQSGKRMYARRVPTVDKLEVINIQISNWTDIEYAIVKLSGHDFYEDSYSRAKIEVDGMTFYGSDMVYGGRDWVTVNVTRPLDETTLFDFQRISVEPRFTEINIGDVISNTPNKVLITFKNGIEYTEDIKVHLLHYLRGNYELSIVEYNANSTNNAILESVFVELPLIESPMKMEFYIEPILSIRTIFNNIPFEFKLSPLNSPISYLIRLPFLPLPYLPLKYIQWAQ
jgi:hypothetical protein